MTKNSIWIHDRIIATQPKKLRMPLLCALNKSLAAPIFSEGWNEMTRGLNTHYYQLKENESYITTIAANNESTVAMGSGHPDGNIVFIKEDVQDKENEITSTRFHEIHQTQLHRPIYSLDWFQQHLLAGSNQGVIQLYDTQYLDEEQLELLGEYHSNYIPTCFWAPPQKCAPNSHVKSVSFSPSYVDPAALQIATNKSCHFLSTATSHIELWDTNYPGTNNLRTFKPDDSSINVAQWSLLSPSLFVAGGQSGHLYVCDLRIQENQAVVWKGLEAHPGSILDAQFNPFIPYWLASTGDDSIVNIWDLRATCHKPLAKIDGHLGPVTSVAWGNTRPEKLATTSRDGTFRLWSLSESTIPIWETCYRKDDAMQTNDATQDWIRDEEEHWWPGSIVAETNMIDDDFGMAPDNALLENDQVELVGAFGIGEWGKMDIGPLYYSNTHTQSKGSVVKVLPSKSRPGQFYCATSFGQLCSQIFRPTSHGLLDYPHRFDYNIDPLYYTIDNAIHYRHIRVAENLIDKLKSLPIDDEKQKRLRDDHVKDFEDCLQLRPRIQPSEWEIDCIPRHESKRLWTERDKWQCALDTFRKDLAYWRSRIAPGCVTLFDRIPLDTGDLHPRLSSELMQGNISDEALHKGPASPPPQLISTYGTSRHDSESFPKQRLRRSSTTPNMASDDLSTPFEDINQRSSSGTLLNTGINWKPLQRAKTSISAAQRDYHFSPSPALPRMEPLQENEQPPNDDHNARLADSPPINNTPPASPRDKSFKSMIKHGSFKNPLSRRSTNDNLDDIRQGDSADLPTTNERDTDDKIYPDNGLNNQPSDASATDNTAPSFKHERSLKSIIKHGSFRKPPSKRSTLESLDDKRQDDIADDTLSSSTTYQPDINAKGHIGGGIVHPDSRLSEPPGIDITPRGMDLKSIIKHGSFRRPRSRKSNDSFNDKRQGDLTDSAPPSPIAKHSPASKSSPTAKHSPAVNSSPKAKASPTTNPFVTKASPTTHPSPVTKTPPTTHPSPVSKTRSTIKTPPVTKTPPTINTSPVVKTPPTNKVTGIDYEDMDQDKQNLDTRNGDNTLTTSPQEMDLKSIIKYGSFKQPLDKTLNDGKRQPMNSKENQSKRGSAGSSTADNQRTALTSKDLNQLPSNNDGDEDRPTLRRQPSSILSPAKSLSRAFTKRLRRKKTSTSSLSPSTAYSPSDRDPEQHRQPPQLDASRSSSRDAL